MFVDFNSHSLTEHDSICTIACQCDHDVLFEMHDGNSARCIRWQMPIDILAHIGRQYLIETSCIAGDAACSPFVLQGEFIDEAQK